MKFCSVEGKVRSRRNLYWSFFNGKRKILHSEYSNAIHHFSIQNFFEPGNCLICQKILTKSSNNYQKLVWSALARINTKRKETEMSVSVKYHLDVAPSLYGSLLSWCYKQHNKKWLICGKLQYQKLERISKGDRNTRKNLIDERARLTKSGSGPRQPTIPPTGIINQEIGNTLLKNLRQNT